jgi:hypothetical protein
LPVLPASVCVFRDWCVVDLWPWAVSFTLEGLDSGGVFIQERIPLRADDRACCIPSVR